MIELKNRLTFPNVIGILLEHKKNTYQQYNMISDLFSRCLEKHASEDADLIAEDIIPCSVASAAVQDLYLQVLLNSMMKKMVGAQWKKILVIPLSQIF